MSNSSYELSSLGPGAFEQLVNTLALKVLGSGHSGFGPGPDGGRDGVFEGDAPYPSATNRWNGLWYLQSKFHAPHLSKDPQKWLIEKVKEEIRLFEGYHQNRRRWPDNWIIATNIDPSGAAETGAYDACRQLVAAARPGLAPNFHIWGGRKILDLLIDHPQIAEYYGEFITPGQVLGVLRGILSNKYANSKDILDYFVVRRFHDHKYTKLEQAGASSDTRPGIETLFVDLPVISGNRRLDSKATSLLAHSSDRIHRRQNQTILTSRDIGDGHSIPAIAPVWFLKAGPGQGKSTVTQFLSQVHRAAIIDAGLVEIAPKLHETVRSMKEVATRLNVWPQQPRVPIYIDLKDYARWVAHQEKFEPKGVLSYLCSVIRAKIGSDVLVKTLKELFESVRTFFVFDGLDEVPGMIKDEVAGEVVSFISDEIGSSSADALTVCTSRPQGYSGQYASLDCAHVSFAPLSPDEALDCARPLLLIDRTEDEAAVYERLLKAALGSEAVQELMTSPLQAHIMAVVVRDGGRPPERRWRLFDNFYNVIKRRETSKSQDNAALAKILQDGETLIKALHNRLGFKLHAAAENSQGAETSMPRAELEGEIELVVRTLGSSNVAETCGILSEATTERLVLVNTPEDGESVRFDVRPLQEFFASEYVSDHNDLQKFGQRIEVISPDPHWREVLHFTLSGLVENGRHIEVQVALSVISSLDEARELTRDIKVQSGIAELPAWRLLSEGVLEADQRVRASFRGLIERTGPKLIPPMVALKVRGDSRRWVANVLFEHISSHRDAHCVGAAILLFFLLEEGDPRTEELKSRVLASADDFLSIVVHRVALWGEDHSRLSDWALAFLVNLLANDASLRLTDKALWQLLSLVGEDYERLREIKAILDMPGPVVENIHLVMGAYDPTRSGQHHVRSEEKEYCTVHYFTTEKGLLGGWVDALVALDWQPSGYLGNVFSLLALSRGKVDAHERAVLKKMSVSNLQHRHLPSYLEIELTPIWRSELAEGRSEIFRKKNAGLTADYERKNVDLKSVDISKFADDDAAWAFAQAIDRNEDGSRGILLDGLIDYLDEFFLSYMFHHLGHLISNGNVSRSGAMKVIEKLPRRRHGPIYFVGDRPITPVAIDVVSEANLIPAIVSELFPVSEANDVTFKDSQWVVARHNVTELLKDYFPDAQRLYDLVSQADDREVKAACVVAYMFHLDRRPAELEALYARLSDFCTKNNARWFPQVCIWALTPLFKSDKEAALSLVASLLRAAGEQFEARYSLESGLALWREIDHAPVNNSANDKLWKYEWA